MSLPLKGLRLLVVEDEALVAMLVEDILTDLGCVVVDVIGSLEEGLAAVARTAAASIDGAILDVNLGGRKVFPIADALQERGVKFVFATGYGTNGMDPRYADCAVLAKPFQREELERMLVRVLA